MRCAFILLLYVALVAQEPRFGAQSRLVLMPVSVKDRSGQPIDGLEAADFAVLDEGRPRKFSPHFNVTRHPTAEWVVQQLREAFPEAGPYRYVILDRNSKFDADVITFLKATGLKPRRTSLQSP